MSHPFGELLATYRARKPGLSQAKLAHLAGYDPSLLARMCHGKKDLTGPSGRERVVRIVETLHDLGVLSELGEADALLSAAGMPPLFAQSPVEAKLIGRLHASSASRSIPNNLPIQLTSFVGREREIADLAARVKTTRLLTLTGAGGVGKSRLALEVATHVLNRFADGVWLVELAPLNDSASVEQAVMSALDAPEQAGRERLDALVDYLMPRQLLIVLDNCEHLIGACAGLVAHLLGRCPRLRLIATSRETLRVPGETAYRVPSLTSPRGDATRAELENYEAARLFIERARLSQPAFDLTPGNANVVARLCAKLDGIPLALELAAGLVQTMTVQEIASRLDDHLALPSGGYRTAPPRHQTMHSALDWSFALLSPDEQTLLGCASVFAGGWTAEAAEAVCKLPSPSEREIGGEGEVALMQTLPLLHELTRKSLVIAEPRDGQTRYRLLEPIRQYAAEKLRDSSEDDELRERHLAYFVELAERAEIGMRGPELGKWMTHLEAEDDNLRAAFDWSQSGAQDPTLGLRLATSLWKFRLIRSPLDEGDQHIEHALARCHDLPPALRARALYAKGLFHWARSYHWIRVELPEMLAAAQACLPLCRRLNDPIGVAYCLLMFATHVLRRKDLVEAHALCEEALTYFNAAEDLWGQAHTLNVLGIVLSLQEKLPLAFKANTSALRLMEQIGSEADVVIALDALARTSQMLGDHDQALALWEQAWMRSIESRVTWDNATTLYVMMGITQVGPQRAIALCEQLLERARSTGSKLQIAAALNALGRVLLDTGDLARAAPALEESLALWRELGVRWHPMQGVASVALEAGWIARKRGDYKRAGELFNEKLLIEREANDIRNVAGTMLFLGHLSLDQGDLASAAEHFRACVVMWRQVHRWQIMPAALTALAELAYRRGEAEAASRMAGAAQAAFHPFQLNGFRPFLVEDYRRIIAAARARLGNPTLAAAWAEGQAMTLDQAVDYGLAVIGSTAA